MSTEKGLQNSRSGLDLQAPNTRTNTKWNLFLPFNQNQIRQFFELVKILVDKSIKLEKQLVKALEPSRFNGDLENLERFLK